MIRIESKTATGNRGNAVLDQTAHTTEPTEDGQAEPLSIGRAMQRFKPLLPLIIGLAFGRAGLIVTSYGSYTHTDEDFFTDGAMLVSLVFLGLAFVAITVSKKTIGKCAVNRIMRACVALEALALVALALYDLAGIASDGIRFAFCTLSTIVASGAIYYWLRRARGTSTIVAAVFVFSALIVSEVEIYLCALVPVYAGNFFAAALVLMQYPCMLWARKSTLPSSIKSPTLEGDYFGFTKTMIQSKQFLTATAIGIACLSVVIGFLRGYPDGQSIAFSFGTRLAYGLLTIAVSALIIALVMRGKKRIMTVGIFVVMEGLACGALLLYAAFPDMLDIGAVLTTTLNALMVGFTWYVIIAFMSYGWRDPYYYAIAGWLVWLGARAIARILLFEAYPIASNDMFVNALMGAMIVASTQVIFVQFLNIAHIDEAENAETAKIAAQRSMLTKVMGLDEHESLSSMRQASMEHNAREMGKQFLLSDREIEVLAFYALGFTQKRVAEELYITPATAHAHIKRIYAKTGLHSRQEVLDYLQQYTS